ncbi:MAG: hypothetical protein AB7N76_03575 [Planctomycetota bacterium]
MTGTGRQGPGGLRFSHPDPSAPSVIYLPPRHYPTVRVQAPGRYRFDPATHELEVWADPSGPNTIVVTP